ncbi:MAG: hypothetical protein F6K00_21435 [Leptolyngbya sp. SIOISBB]|nr:hypothetical protein [Leptolyngbya sp. SIOISBB]
MKPNHFVFALLSGLMIFAVSFLPLSPAQASNLSMTPTLGFSLFSFSSNSDETSALKQLKSEVMPKLGDILTPRQQKIFEDRISSGESFRRTFRSLMLTPDQKRKIKSVINTIPRKDAFAALSPMEKKELFLKKKEAFMPSSEEIINKIEASSPEGIGVPEAVKKKIKKGIEMRDTFMPTSEEIMDKVKAGMEKAGETLEDLQEELD